jgi:Domain of unknown function (DUF4349)/PKD domain
MEIGRITAKRAAVFLGAVILAGGVVLGVLSSPMLGLYGAFGASSSANIGLPNNAVVGYNGTSADSGSGSVFGGLGTVPTNPTEIFGTTTETSTATTTFGGVSPSGNGTQGAPSGGGGLLEFSSQLSLTSAAPEQTAASVVALAYSVGGYVAYQSTFQSSANVVIRVPAADYQQVLGQVSSMGKIVSITSNSNDVSVQYTDLNASLASLTTEQGALLRLLNASTSINSTLAIESQLQGVDAQVNEVESQILQTRTLISYSTIDVTINESPQSSPLSMTLSASPRSGVEPLSVTFDAVAKGGSAPYVVNYNFGDGYTSQGQIVIHTYFSPGEYNVTVTVTDQNGTVVAASTMIDVKPIPGQSGLNSFLGTVSGLFLDVVAGIVEVASVVIPLAAVGFVLVLPFRRRGRGQKEVRQQAQ